MGDATRACMSGLPSNWKGVRSKASHIHFPIIPPSMTPKTPQAAVYIYTVFRNQLPFMLLAKVKELDLHEGLRKD
jgi:hypothetical protein